MDNMDNFNSKSESMNKSRVTLNSLDIMVSAMWELMLEKGFTREQMNAKIDEIKERKVTLDPQRTRAKCPGCGRLVSESPKTPFEGKCFYCGQTVTIYPGDSIDFAGNDDPSSDNGSPAFDDQDLF